MVLLNVFCGMKANTILRKSTDTVQLVVNRVLVCQTMKTACSACHPPIRADRVTTC